MNDYIVTINYKIDSPASPLHGVVRTTARHYRAESGPAATATARKNFLGSRSASIKILSTDVHDAAGRYAY